jgi:arsenite-transporting ATPase
MGKVIFFGGKGGVGKTSCSSAYSLARAGEGSKVLLVSTDPAHSISDLFNRKIGSEIINIQKNLDALEIDPEKESDKYIKGIRGNMTKIFSPIILEEINKQLDAAKVSPGSHESALFDKIIEIVNEKSDEYDYIIFDTAPTGHTIRLLSLPELLGSWMDNLLIKRRKALKLKSMADREDYSDDPIVEILKKRKTNMEKAREFMMNDENLEFIFVLNAERMPIEETKKAVDMLLKYNMIVKKLVVNKILPENSTDDFWIAKKKAERGYLDRIENEFDMKHVYKIPMLMDDIREDTVESIAKYFKD